VFDPVSQVLHGKAHIKLSDNSFVIESILYPSCVYEEKAKLSVLSFAIGFLRLNIVNLTLLGIFSNVSKAPSTVIVYFFSSKIHLMVSSTPQIALQYNSLSIILIY